MMLSSWRLPQRRRIVSSSFLVVRCRRCRATPPSSSREGWCGDDRHRRRALRPVLLAVDDVDAQSTPSSTTLTRTEDHGRSGRVTAAAAADVA